MYQNAVDRWFPQAFLRKLEGEVSRNLRKKENNCESNMALWENKRSPFMHLNTISVVGF
jgi:hypothetical protein